MDSRRVFRLDGIGATSDTSTEEARSDERRADDRRTGDRRAASRSTGDRRTGDRRARAQRNRRGTTAVLAALVMATLLGGAAVALDLGKMYIAKTTAQRIADQSAMAAAFAYSQGRDTGTFAQDAASSLATANGAANATVTAKIVASPTGDGNSAAMVVVSAPVSLSLLSSSIQPGTATATVSATAYAEIQDVSACFIALTSAGVTGTGGVSLTGNGCTVASAGVITANNGAQFIAQGFNAVGAITTTQGGSITTTPTAGALVSPSSAPSDPYNTDHNNNGIFDRVNSLPNYVTSLSALNLGTAPSGGANQTCSSGLLSLPAGSYGNVTISGTCSLVAFQGGAGTTTNIGYLATNGWSGTIIFGDGTFKINGVYVNGGNVTMSDSNPTAVFDIWSGFNTQSGTTSNLTFNGPSNFFITGGINNYGSGTMTFANTFSSSPSNFTVAGGINMTHGNGVFPNGVYKITSGGIWNANTSVTFGNGSFDIMGGIQFGSGGGSMTFGSALDGNSVFQVPSPTNGNAIQTTGSSTLSIGSFTNIDLIGNVVIAGNLYLGAGTYSIGASGSANGDFSANATGGGTLSASNVSIVAAGAISFGQGYNNITLTAPSTISTGTLGTSPTIAIASNTTSGATVTSGATNTTITGAIYLPRAALTLAGGGAVSGQGGCAVVDVASASFTGGGSFTTTCSGVSSITTAGAALVR